MEEGVCGGGAGLALEENRERLTPSPRLNASWARDAARLPRGGGWGRGGGGGHSH